MFDGNEFINFRSEIVILIYTIVSILVNVLPYMPLVNVLPYAIAIENTLDQLYNLSGGNVYVAVICIFENIPPPFPSATTPPHYTSIACMYSYVPEPCVKHIM